MRKVIHFGIVFPTLLVFKRQSSTVSKNKSLCCNPKCCNEINTPIIWIVGSTTNSVEHKAGNTTMRIVGNTCKHTHVEHTNTHMTCIHLLLMLSCG